MTPAPRLLIAEDEPAIREGLCDALESDGFRVTATASGPDALRAFREHGADLLLLDIMMPGLSGYEVCRELRRENARVPILMLSAKGGEIDKVLGLELGADDYLTKPFGVRELLARVHALLRRSRAPASADAPDKSAFDFGPARIDPRTLSGQLNGKTFDLTPRELALLQTFAARPGEVLSRDELLNRVWGIEYYGTTRTLDQHIAQLRKKIEPDRNRPSVLLTVHGAGYRHQP
jgi:DNA-binding response OmpR family regulator